MGINLSGLLGPLVGAATGAAGDYAQAQAQAGLRTQQQLMEAVMLQRQQQMDQIANGLHLAQTQEALAMPGYRQGMLTAAQARAQAEQDRAQTETERLQQPRPLQFVPGAVVPTVVDPTAPGGFRQLTGIRTKPSGDPALRQLTAANGVLSGLNLQVQRTRQQMDDLNKVAQTAGIGDLGAVTGADGPPKPGEMAMRQRYKGYQAQLQQLQGQAAQIGARQAQLAQGALGIPVAPPPAPPAAPKGGPVQLTKPQYEAFKAAGYSDADLAKVYKLP